MKKFLIAFLILLSQPSVFGYNAAIVMNFENEEIDSLKTYLNSMGINSRVFDKNYITYDSVAAFDMLIWDDLGYQANGITNSCVSIFHQYHQNGKPIYFIGDDLAYSIINLSSPWDTIWTGLIHLTGENNFSQSFNVLISNSNHLVTNGPYGLVSNFVYNEDIDLALHTNTGEVLLANTSDSDVLLAHNQSNTKTVVQNCCIFINGNEQNSILQRKKLFKNAVAWLLNLTAINQIETEIPNLFSISQNYPNPFNPLTKIRFDVPRSENVIIKIYDMLGKEIATLVNQHLHPGTYETDWDASVYSSGIYYCKITAGDYSGTKKMVLVK